MDEVKAALAVVAGGLGPYGPKIVGALVLALVAWVASRLVRGGVLRVCLRRGLDSRLQTPGFSLMLANIGAGVVWLLALPGLLETLELQGLLVPVNVMMSRIMGFLPNLVGAGVVFAIGFLVARILRQIVTGLLRAAGSERLAERLGLATSLGEHGLAGLVGSMVFSFVLLPVLAAALEPLGLDAVTQPVSHLLDTIVALIPKVTASVIILAISALIGRAVSGIVAGLLGGMGFNKLPQQLGMSAGLLPGGRSASELAGSVVMGAIVLVALMQACEVLGFSILTRLVADIGAAVARVMVAVVVMLAGLWLSAAAMRVIRAGSAANAPALAQMARLAILFFTAALALRQAGLPGDIVAIAFGGVVGALAIGVAVAVGVGGRHVAGRLLEEAVAALRTRRPDSPPPIRFPD
ncbi:putative transporter (transmembrane protein) [Sphaerotilus hippei]|uniref:Small-conductance mechanosensitive channel n=1 Tax=Sphaerotilus hippei TaxID=744406 RepID=A0A318H0H4_9BURK|nr:mechanosensitive ion channel [Sphaerotilus hippei]PXW94722.1 putative transporter (transmembrane protein) [Sphaerotilus hippei]